MNLNLTNRNRIVVGMADLQVMKETGTLTTLGLGSCVGIALYCNISKVGGLAHCMLPDSTQIKNNGNIAKFVDTATVALISKMRTLGARQNNIKAKLAGGAQMFALNSTNENMRIGERNTEASIKILKSLGIPIISQDVGNSYGRTVELLMESGDYIIKTIGHGQKVI